jgi:hypothetical protein
MFSVDKNKLDADYTWAGNKWGDVNRVTGQWGGLIGQVRVFKIILWGKTMGNHNRMIARNPFGRAC